jgi:uncharacterized glyoxalase superfamily protein PhnB
MIVQQSFFVLYVNEQSRAASYYGRIFGIEPILDVPGITEFEVREGCVVALLPIAGAARLLSLPDLAPAPEILKAELYLIVENPEAYHQRALECGGRELSPMQVRDWGHRAAYSVDPDGHVLAFAERIGESGG